MALALRMAARSIAARRAAPAAEREHEALMRRLLTPAAKYWVCKRGSHFAQEAMECWAATATSKATARA